MVVAEVPLWVVHTSSSENAGNALVPASNHHFQQRAAASLSLLETSGKARKCAIYSIDIHPDATKFATAGGDGTVRLWNAAALFSSKHKGGQYQESGAYVSTSGSGAEESSEGGITSAGEDNNLRDEMVHDLNSVVRKKKDGSSSPQKTKSAMQPAIAPSPSRAKGHKHQRLLCTMSAHTGSSVLAVRFSTTGNYLASAGDDGCVCIYAPDNSSSQPQGNLVESHNDEHWSRIKLCRGHGLDVVGLAWAPDDSHLVSCSLDSETPIIVWKLTDLNSGRRNTHSMIVNPFKVLGKDIHTSTVKGVTFDPAGSYLASSGDDPAVCIWRAHDDWGLEKRIDAGSGIFRRWKEDDTQTLSSQSLFRRISWSTDGAFICSTNSVVKNKHVASTISREGWSVSSASSSAAGAANLVGHKQPVVVCRHASQLLDARKSTDQDEDEEPEYATLLALGDKKGFVTVWSTRKSRPIFKLQCSESRCTVTDLAWGSLPNGDLMLLVSLLDGQVVALRFGVPNELGAILSEKERGRVFQLRYGIDMDESGGMGQRRLFVGESSGPKLIENALQMSLEDRNIEDDESENEIGFPGANEEMAINELTPRTVKGQQKESRAKGKKRVQPLLMNVHPIQKRQKTSTSQEKKSSTEAKEAEKRKSADPMQSALEAAEKASAATESVAASKRLASTTEQPSTEVGRGPHTPSRHHIRQVQSHPIALPTAAPIPHSTDRIHSVDLPPLEEQTISLINMEKPRFTAECTSSFKVPAGSKGASIPCTDLSISQNGRVLWKDQIPGTSCSAIAASKHILAIGFADGSVQLYGGSPTLGWATGHSFRSHPPLVLGQSIVALQLHEEQSRDERAESNVCMLVVTADGAFGVYNIVPELCLQYKGSIMPAMTHMALGSSAAVEHRLPKLSRVQITESGRLLLLLSFQSAPVSSDDHSSQRSASRSESGGVGGSLQAFVYSKASELWMRVSDSRFVLSDFYTSLSSAKTKSDSVLSRIDDSVRTGSLESSLRPSHRGRLGSERHTDAVYNQAEEDSGNFVATRSHCEDRIACAIALKSSSEFKEWLSLYARTLSIGGQGTLLRMLVDMLLGEIQEASDAVQSSVNTAWWLFSAPQILGLDRKMLVRTIILPEMSKNRALQRMTNEVSLETQS